MHRLTTPRSSRPNGQTAQDVTRYWRYASCPNLCVRLALILCQVVGNNSALTLAYDLVRPFGIISSVGVHQEPPLPFAGRDVYNKNVSFDFGRCPVRAMFPIAFEILLKRQDVFGNVGEKASLIDRIVSLDEAPQVYEEFDKGRCGKILFDPWR